MPNKILIIDNGSIYLSKLRDICIGSAVDILQPGEIDPAVATDFDLILLSGGSQYEVMGNEQHFAQEMELIRQAHTPIIGICLGFQLIAHTFKMPVHKLKHKEFGVHMLHMTKRGKQILGPGPYEVFDDHFWVVEKTPEHFQTIATSESGLEAIIHDSLPIAGVQFHPEMFVSQNDGLLIYQNILKIFRNRKKN